MSELWSVFIIIYLIFSLLLVLLERKFLAFAQRRLGPSILGRNGSLQVLWDLGKLYTKNIFLIPHLMVNESYLILILLYSTQFFICMHFIMGPNLYLFKNVDSLILYNLFFTAASQALLIWLALVAQSRYVLLSVIRAVVQIISFDIFIIIIFIIIMLTSQSTHFINFILFQSKTSYFFICNFIGLLFFISLLFEAKRTPFDHLETESEVIAGYTTEYNSIVLLFLYLIEYLHLIIGSFIFVIFFCGGWYFYIDLINIIFPFMYCV